ncbi:hypothetical protein DIS18_10620 [Algibacter marinivivus]|uniref:DUF11 domain-containing protein n=1 Tax=Algibacter marinivivus TaxID=2100723 RepID=A0A2U2X4H3_9FLAO|nr:hypothetical protein DIS18_10620 [Algibacter marinivivus]
MGNSYLHINEFPLAKQTLIILCIGLFGSIPYVSAQIQQEFSPRFNEMVRGDFTLIANNVISRTATGAYNGEGDNHDFVDNVYVDIDNDDSTFNSSSANFTNPEPQLACVSIKKAYLYWAAADKENEEGEDNVPDWNFNDVKLMLPGENEYTTLTADEVIYRGRDTHFSNDPYICFKDITALVTNLESPFGKYQLANIEAKTGFLFQHSDGNTGTSGGWQIVYVYESPKLVSKNVSIFDGYAHITRDFNSYDVSFSGFQTIPNGPVNVNTLIGALEGDRGLIGDRFQIQNIAGDYIDLTAPLRNSDNFFNSRITIDNTNFTDRNPASLNTLGFDAAVFQLDNTNNSIIGNSQTSASIRLASNQETYGLFLIGLSVEVWVPDLYPILVNSSAVDNTTNASSTVTYSFNVSNTGNDNALNVLFSETLPVNIEFVSADNLPVGVTYSYNLDTRLLQFFIEDGLVDIGDDPLNIEFDVIVREACYFLEENCDLDFDIQFEASYSGEQNPNNFMASSSSVLDDCQIGNPLTTIINQPIPQWATPIGSLDREISSNNQNELMNAQALFPVPDICDFNIIKTTGDFIQNSDCDYNGSYTNTWTFTDACGRTIEDFTQIISVTSNRVFDGSNITISKVVTPNQDQWNEYFTVNEIKDCGFVVDLKIFNRWGAIIYQSDNYQNNWNGTASSSAIGSANQVPSGTYFYIINMMKSGLAPIAGTLYLGTK